MIAVEELAAAPVLASVPPDDLARVARAAGDVRLAPGEYAVHEGDERALFAVLTGGIEVTKAIDGIERVIGVRAPGQIFGEVPITFGTPFQGSYRATEHAEQSRDLARNLAVNFGQRTDLGSELRRAGGRSHREHCSAAADAVAEHLGKLGCIRRAA